MNMPTKKIKLTPDTDHPFPYSLNPERPKSKQDELAVVANTVEVMEELGLDPDKKIAEERDAEESGEKRSPDAVAVAAALSDDETEHGTHELIRKALENKKTITSYPVASAASGFLRAYGQSLALDVVQARAAITTKLMEIADCGDTKYELRALELLGKHSDIGLFTERSEININYNTPEALEEAIKSRVKRLLNARITEEAPLDEGLDEEFGFNTYRNSQAAAVIDGEFEEVEGGDVGGHSEGGAGGAGPMEGGDERYHVRERTTRSPARKKSKKK